MAKHQSLQDRQRGAVAIIVGLLSVLVLFGFMGIAIDLSYLYARKTELQNAADAAALSGAKELNQTAGGIDSAVLAATNTFLANAGNNLIDGEMIDGANIRFGPCPNARDHDPVRSPECDFVSVDAAKANAGQYSFIEVNTGPASNKPVFFMPVIGGQSEASASGYAVAGYYLNQLTPIGICSITNKRYDSYAHGEVLEYGFRRGMSYDIMAMGPLGSNSLPYLVNPVDTDPATCDPANSSANFTVPFVCTGSSAIAKGQSPWSAIGNTGLSNVVVMALNSRFGLYGGAGWGTNQCDPQSAPPDSNVMQYCYRTQGGRCFGQPGASWVPDGISAHDNTYGEDPASVAAWDSPEPTYQTVQLNSTSKKPCYNATPNIQGTPGSGFAAAIGCSGISGGPNYGVLWSYGPAYKGVLNGGGGETVGVGNKFTAVEANAQAQMYNNGPTPMTYFGANYNDSMPPYLKFVKGPPSSLGVSGVPGRRIINILLIDCDNVTGAGACGQNLPVNAIGRFFLPVMADPTGNKKIQAEFAGLVDPLQKAEIKLYR